MRELMNRKSLHNYRVHSCGSIFADRSSNIGIFKMTFVLALSPYASYKSTISSLPLSLRRLLNDFKRFDVMSIPIDFRDAGLTESVFFLPTPLSSTEQSR